MKKEAAVASSSIEALNEEPNDPSNITSNEKSKLTFNRRELLRLLNPLFSEEILEGDASSNTSSNTNHSVGTTRRMQDSLDQNNPRLSLNENAVSLAQLKKRLEYAQSEEIDLSLEDCLSYLKCVSEMSPVENEEENGAKIKRKTAKNKKKIKKQRLVIQSFHLLVVQTMARSLINREYSLGRMEKTNYEKCLSEFKSKEEVSVDQKISVDHQSVDQEKRLFWKLPKFISKILKSLKSWKKRLLFYILGGGIVALAGMENVIGMHSLVSLITGFFGVAVTAVSPWIVFPISIVFGVVGAIIYFSFQGRLLQEEFGLRNVNQTEELCEVYLKLIDQLSALNLLMLRSFHLNSLLNPLCSFGKNDLNTEGQKYYAEVLNEYAGVLNFLNHDLKAEKVFFSQVHNQYQKRHKKMAGLSYVLMGLGCILAGGGSVFLAKSTLMLIFGATAAIVSSTPVLATLAVAIAIIWVSSYWMMRSKRVSNLFTPLFDVFQNLHKKFGEFKDENFKFKPTLSPRLVSDGSNKVENNPSNKDRIKNSLDKHHNIKNSNNNVFSIPHQRKTPDRTPNHTDIPNDFSHLSKSV